MIGALSLLRGTECHFSMMERRGHFARLAEEVSQNVLCAVARKAPALVKHPERLSAWLHRATLFETSKVMRSEQSRQRRQKLLHPDDAAATSNSDDDVWQLAKRHLDQALNQLGTSDRSVVLQHYFEGKTFVAIGREQAPPPATVQKQCRRALENLSRVLRKRGVALSATALISGLGTQVAKAALGGLLQSVPTYVLSGGSASSAGRSAFEVILQSKAMLPVAVGWLALLAVPVVMQQKAISQAVARNESLRAASASESQSARRVQNTRNLVTKTIPSGQKVTTDMLYRSRKSSLPVDEQRAGRSGFISEKK
jgi:DNA-directed RNA polymerase specialized sigma24 family protein